MNKINVSTLPRSMNTQLDSFATLVDFHARLLGDEKRIDILDMSNLRWFDACLCSPLAAILYPYISESTVADFGSRDKLAGILRRNNFTKKIFNDAEASNQASTAVSFERFQASDENHFLEYIAEFCAPGKREFPSMTPNLLKKFREAILEIFNNSVEHSETIDGIFACGQFFPNKHQLKFSVTDRGIGVVERIRKSLNASIEAQEAVAWVFRDGATTRISPNSESGGFGLKLIRDFVDVNEGRLVFVSGQGYYERKAKVEGYAVLPYHFPGTSVIIEINTASHSGYKFSNE